MQTFGLTLQLSLKAVIHETFLAEARKEATADTATLFLKAMQEKYPEDDDQFMLAILKNALRTQTRMKVLEFMSFAGVGGAVSPVQIMSESICQPRGAVAAFAASTDASKSEGPTKAVQLRIGQDTQAELLEGKPAGTPGEIVQGLVEGRTE